MNKFAAFAAGTLFSMSLSAQKQKKNLKKKDLYLLP